MVEINDLTYSYEPQKHLFDQVNLTLSSGNIYGILGKNGAGKSTLIKLITGMVFPKTGNVDVVGFNPKDRKPDFLQEVFLINEEFYLPNMPMNKYIDLYSPFYPRFSHEALEEYLTEFGVPKDTKLHKLSFGQKKKFLISFGLATDCKLLVLDEPTNGLDIPSKSKFRKVVANAIHEDRSFIISTHQARDMENLIDPIIIIDEGQIVFHADSFDIAQKLSLSKQSDLPQGNHIIYTESSLGGYTVISTNDGEDESNIGLEILFNAVISNKEKIHEIFNN
ncbi:MAG: ABC transporter ATP-binding protein [Reichenbachiella sp.]